MKRCVTSLVIREVQTKTMRCHSIITKTAATEKTATSWQGWRATTTSYVAGGNVKWYNYCEKQLRNFTKVQNINPPYDPPGLLRSLTREQRRHLFTQTRVHECSSLLYSSKPQTGDDPMLLNKWMNKQTETSIQSLATKKDEPLIQTTWMNRKTIILSERSQVWFCLYNII